MNSAETIERVPIHTGADGVRVAGARVTLDTIVGAFDTGATAEEIAQQYYLHFRTKLGSNRRAPVRPDDAL